MIKDNNIGHENIKVLLDELLKNYNFDIEERSVKGSLPSRHINKVNKNYYDIIIGAGHKTYPFIKFKKIKKTYKNYSYTALLLKIKFILFVHLFMINLNSII